MAIEKRVEEHIIDSKCRFPYLVLGSGPTQSTMTLRKTIQKPVRAGVELHECVDSVST